MHYTAPNVTDRQRRAFAIHFMTPGTKSLRDLDYLDVSFARPVLRMRVGAGSDHRVGAGAVEG